MSGTIKRLAGQIKKSVAGRSHIGGSKRRNGLGPMGHGASAGRTRNTREDSMTAQFLTPETMNEVVNAIKLLRHDRRRRYLFGGNPKADAQDLTSLGRRLFELNAEVVRATGDPRARPPEYSWSPAAAHSADGGRIRALEAMCRLLYQCGDIERSDLLPLIGALQKACKELSRDVEIVSETIGSQYLPPVRTECSRKAVSHEN